MIRKKCAGYYYYAANEEDWSVNTDYQNGKIYLSGPTDDEATETIENYGKAILRAVKDFRKDVG